MIESIQNRVIRLIAQVMRRDELSITSESRFAEDLGADSLSVVELACLVEDEFGIAMADGRVPNLQTVGDVVSALQLQAVHK
jgi:acyl carrier protein